jgi:hypothetical protein
VPQQGKHGAGDVVIQLCAESDVVGFEVLAAQELGHAGGSPGVHDDLRAAIAVRGVDDEAAPPSLRQQPVSQVV